MFSIDLLKFKYYNLKCKIIATLKLLQLQVCTKYILTVACVVFISSIKLSMSSLVAWPAKGFIESTVLFDFFFNCIGF
jgi:hypothetical protein